MKNVGHWDTKFQDDTDIITITEAHVAHTNSPAWRPDPRGQHIAPYHKDMIGMPEWAGNQAGWNLAYRDINISYITGFALTFLIMDEARALWNKDTYFDYADRANGAIRHATAHVPANRAPAFVQAMWDAYRADYPSTYDQKWEDEKIIKWCTMQRFLLAPVPVYHTFRVGEPIRMNVGHPVDLAGVTPATVTVTDPSGAALPIAAIETEKKVDATFTIKFAEGVEIKPGVNYTVKLADAVTAPWRSPIGLPLMNNQTHFGVK